MAKRSGPQRTCLGCREGRDQQDLVRFVLSPGGELIVDYRKKLPGRGAYTCFNRGCLEQALKRKQFDRTFKGPVAVSGCQTLWGELKMQLEERIQGLLGVARKSRLTLAGSGPVLDALGNPGTLNLVVVATDISGKIGERVMGKARAVGVDCYQHFAKEQLGRFTGKAESSVLALRPGGLTGALKVELSRYEHMSEEP